MKKLVAIVILYLVILQSFAQTNASIDNLKYVITAPDGSDAIGLYDSSENQTIQLKMRETFYKYQLLDMHTSEPILSEDNTGKECKINKLRIARGTYKLRLYTEEFVITSEITFDKGLKLVVPQDPESLVTLF